MVATQRRSNETLALLQRTVNAGSGSMSGMRSFATTTFSGKGTTRERVVEDIELVRPTVITKYVIERRWCPHCRAYHQDAVADALPRHRLGLHVLLFVVYQKVALGLSYSKLQRELRSYFGLTISAGELPSLVAEVAALFGPAYARLLQLMRLSAAIHIDETSWRVDGVPHWLWVFVNDVVALYLVSRSRGSKVPQALLGADFDGVVLDMTARAEGDPMTAADAQAELVRIGYELKPLDIVLVRTGRDAHYGRPTYMFRGCGVTAEATRWLYDQGVCVMGIDAWGWDAPLDGQAREALTRRQPGIFWAAHQLDLPYAQIERLVNLDTLPPFGFKISCFPLKIVGGSAGPARVVALLDD